MNIVYYNSNKNTRTVEELCALLKNTRYTAFIGSIGTYRNELFLITYDKIVLAREPRSTWNYVSEFEVYKFVDVEIVVKN